MSSLMDDVLSHTGKAGVSGCRVDKFLKSQETLPVPDGKERRFTREEWEAVMSSDNSQNSAIFKVMVEFGYEGGTTSVSRHRRRDCQCPTN